MAEKEKVLAVKSLDLSISPGTHMVGRGTESYELPSDL